MLPILTRQLPRARAGCHGQVMPCVEAAVCGAGAVRAFPVDRLFCEIMMGSAGMATDKNGFEIPEQMRDFAEKSVDQARKAFDDFMSVTQKAVANVEGSSSAVQSGASDINRKAFGYAEEHVDAAFRFAQQMVRAKDMEEMMKLQQDYLRSQMEQLGEQAREISDAATRTAQDAARAAKD